MEIIDEELFIKNYDSWQEKYCDKFDLNLATAMYYTIQEINKKSPNYQIYNCFFRQATYFLMTETKPHLLNNPNRISPSTRFFKNGNIVDFEVIFIARGHDKQEQWGRHDKFKGKIKDQALYDFSNYPETFILVRKKDKELFESSFAVYLSFWPISASDSLADYFQFQIHRNFDDSLEKFLVFYSGIEKKYGQIIPDSVKAMSLTAISTIKDNNYRYVLLEKQKKELEVKVKELTANLELLEDKQRILLFFRVLLFMGRKFEFYKKAFFIENALESINENKFNSLLKGASGRSTYKYLYGNFRNSKSIQKILLDIEDIAEKLKFTEDKSFAEELNYFMRNYME
jgi:hypothetical protein